MGTVPNPRSNQSPFAAGYDYATAGRDTARLFRQVDLTKAFPRIPG